MIKEYRVSSVDKPAGSSSALFIIQDGYITFVNAQAEELTGYSMSEIIGMKAIQLVHPQDKRPIRNRIRKITANLSPDGSFHCRIIVKSGEIRYLHTTCARLDTYNGKPAIVGSSVAESGRNRIDTIPWNEGEMGSFLFENSPDPIFVKDLHLRYTKANSAMGERLGLPPFHIIGKTSKDFFGKNTAEQLKAMDLQALKGSVVQQNQTFTGGKNKTVFHTIKTPMQNRRGKITGICGMAHDISDDKHSEKALQQSNEKLSKALRNTVNAIALTVEMKDPYTATHQRRVALLSSAISRELHLSPAREEAVCMAAYIHDIGKICVPTEILSKPSLLTGVEFAVIQEHSRNGYNILKEIDFSCPVAQIVFQHHERWNGSGYPRGLKGKEILLEARILAVADVVEAIASHRPYRPALGIERALTEIEEMRERYYDPVVANACLDLFRKKGYSLDAVPH